MTLSTPRSALALTERVAQQKHWFHSIDLGHGVVTPGAKSPEVHRLECEALVDPVDFRGRSVIDIGAWNGFYSFEAKKRGAARVLATDHYVWNSPLFDGRAGFDIARDALDMDVEALDIDVDNIQPSSVGMFDIVLFLGVFYHLPDPIAGLTNVAAITKEVLVVETYIDLLDVPRPAMVYYPGTELGGDGSNWWGPNPQCVLELLTNLGFASVDVRRSLAAGHRAAFHAWRTPRPSVFRDPELLPASA